MAPTLRPRPTRTDFWQPLDFNVSTGRSHSRTNSLNSRTNSFRSRTNSVNSRTNSGHSVSTRRTLSDARRRTRSVQPPERVNPDPHHGVEARARISGHPNGSLSSEVRRAPNSEVRRAPNSEVRRAPSSEVRRAPSSEVRRAPRRLGRLAGSLNGNVGREMVQMSSDRSFGTFDTFGSFGTSSPEEDPPSRRPLPSGAILMRSPRTTLPRIQFPTRTQTPPSFSGSSNFGSSSSGSSTRQRSRSTNQRRTNRKRSRRVGNDSTLLSTDESDLDTEEEEGLMVLEPESGLWIPASQVTRQTSSSASGVQSSNTGESSNIGESFNIGESSNTSLASHESINPGSEVPIRQRLRSRTRGATSGSLNESRLAFRTGVSVGQSSINDSSNLTPSIDNRSNLTPSIDNRSNLTPSINNGSNLTPSINNGSNSTPSTRTRSNVGRVVRPSTASQRSGSSTISSRTTISSRSTIGSRTGVVSISGSKKARRSESPQSGAKVSKYGSSSTCTICLNQVEDLAVLVPCRHEFDNRCIDTWFKEKRNCPVCRTLVTKIRVNYRSESEFTEKELPPLVHDWNRIGQMAPVEMALFLEHVQDLRNVQSSLHRLQTARYHINITLSQL